MLRFSLPEKMQVLAVSNDVSPPLCLYIPLRSIPEKSPLHSIHLQLLHFFLSQRAYSVPLARPPARYIFGRYAFPRSILMLCFYFIYCARCDLSLFFFLNPLQQMATGRLLRVWEAHYKGVTALAWTQDDMFLLSAGEDALLHLWDLTR